MPNPVDQYYTATDPIKTRGLQGRQSHPFFPTPHSLLTTPYEQTYRSLDQDSP